MGKKNRIRMGKLLPLSNKPNSVSTQTDQKDKKMNPLPFNGTFVETKDRIKEIIHSMDRTSIKTEDDDYLHIVVTTKILRFKDDVEFLFDDKTKLVHFRSASRVGQTDLGVNRKRMEKISIIYKGGN